MKGRIKEQQGAKEQGELGKGERGGLRSGKE